MSEDDEANSAVSAGAAVYGLADLVTPMAVRVAATLRIADHIASGSHTSAALAAASDTDADTLDRLLRHLSAVGALTRSASGRYDLTATGDALRDDHPSGIRALLDVTGPIGRAELAFVQLLHSVRTGEAAFPEQFGTAFWDDLASDPERSQSYDAHMGSDVAAWAPAIISAFDWGSLGHVVDVGGGNGSLMVALLTGYPALRGTVFDQPTTAEIARARLTEAGLSDRADAVAGDFFVAVPSGADGYLLTAIIHDWDDHDARAILGRCAQAAGSTGRVFVIEKIGADGATPGPEMDLRLLVYLGGRERSLDSLVLLAEGTGLVVQAVHAAGAIVILELTAA